MEEQARQGCGTTALLLMILVIVAAFVFFGGVGAGMVGGCDVNVPGSCTQHGWDAYNSFFDLTPVPPGGTAWNEGMQDWWNEPANPFTH